MKILKFQDKETDGGGGGEKGKSYLSSELLDVKEHASLYSGRTKLMRLIFIADRCNDELMKLEALKIAYQEIKKGEDINLFREVVENIDGKLGSEYGLDLDWIQNTEWETEAEKHNLESELSDSLFAWEQAVSQPQPQMSLSIPLPEATSIPSSGTTTSPVPVTPIVAVGNQPTVAASGAPYPQDLSAVATSSTSISGNGGVPATTTPAMSTPIASSLDGGVSIQASETNLIKESIRMRYIHLGDFHYSHGHLGDAFEYYARTRNYCTTSEHVLQMCFQLILVSIEMGQLSQVATYVGKAEATPEALDPVAVAKLRCATGLSHLESKKYKLAARKFLETGPELGSNYTEVIAPQDVVTYGGLCALASFDRAELKSKVIDNFQFRNFLELVPELRQIINDLDSSRFASCLENLERLKANLLLDLHLHDHVKLLYRQIYDMVDAYALDNQLQAATDKVVECQSQVSCYQRAIYAVPYMAKALPLKLELKQKLLDLDYLNTSLKGGGKNKRQLCGQKEALALAITKLDEKIEMLGQYTKYGIEGMTVEELELLKSDAKRKLVEASSARSRVNKLKTRRLQAADQDKAEACLPEEQTGCQKTCP